MFSHARINELYKTQATNDQAPPPLRRCAYIGFQMFIHPKRRISAFLSTAFTLRAGGEKSSEHIPEETHIGYISV